MLALKRLTTLIVLLSVFVSAFAETKTVTILAINDMHANLGQMPKLGAIIDSLRAVYPDLFVVSAGDNRTGDPFNDAYKEPSRPMTEIMNTLGFRASAVGNHEFDSDIPAFRTEFFRAKFDFLCANIDVPDSMGFAFAPYKIYDIGGVSVGLLGVVQVGNRGIPDCHPDHVRGLTFRPVEPTIALYADSLRTKCAIAILLSHIGYDDDVQMARKFPMFDAIIGGHSHTLVDANTLENNVLITQSANKVRYCTLLKFEVEDGKVTRKTSELINIRATKRKSQEVKMMVDFYCSNPAFDEVICKFQTKIEDKATFGTLIADAQRFATKSQIGIMNGGGVRLESFKQSKFTLKDAMMLDPFDNSMWVFDLKPKQLKQVLLECYENDEHVQPYVSGLKYQMYIGKDGKAKKVKIYAEDGKKLKNSTKYRTAFSSYLLSIVNLKESDGKPSDKSSRGCLIDYLRGEGTISQTPPTRTELIKSK